MKSFLITPYEDLEIKIVDISTPVHSKHSLNYAKSQLGTLEESSVIFNTTTDNEEILYHIIKSYDSITDKISLDMKIEREDVLVNKISNYKNGIITETNLNGINRNFTIKFDYYEETSECIPCG